MVEVALPDRPWPAELDAGAELFDAGRWWDAHEAWEVVWHAAEGEQRRLVQGLILLAAALHKRWHHGSLAHRNYHKARRHLDGLPPRWGRLDLPALQAEVWAALETSAETVPALPQIPRSVPIR